MDFIKEIHEARLTRGEGARSLTYTDCCERAYLTMLVLEVLRKFPGTTPIVQQYARNTSGYDSYKHFRLSGTDLYNFVYFIVGDEDAHKKLKDPGAARRMRERTQFPLMNFNRYVERLRYNRALSWVQASYADATVLEEIYFHSNVSLQEKSKALLLDYF